MKLILEYAIKIIRVVLKNDWWKLSQEQNQNFSDLLSCWLGSNDFRFGGLVPGLFSWKLCWCKVLLFMGQDQRLALNYIARVLKNFSSADPLMNVTCCVIHAWLCWFQILRKSGILHQLFPWVHQKVAFFPGAQQCLVVTYFLWW